MFPEVVQVIPRKDYTVYVYFEDGKIVCYDMKNMLDKEVFKPLRDISVFIDTCTIMNDTLAWDIGGIEMLVNALILIRIRYMNFPIARNK